MTTYAVMRTRITDELMRDDLSTVIASAVQDAIKHWEAERFHFNEKRFRIATVTEQEYYDLVSPTLLSSSGSAVATGETILELDSITCLLSAGDTPYPLTERTLNFFDRNQSTSQGDPDSFMIFGDQLRLWPVPARVTTLTLYGLARLSTLSADLDSNSWTTEGEALIRHQAKLLVYRDVLRDPDGVMLAQSAIESALEPLKRKMGAKLMTGRVKPWSL